MSSLVQRACQTPGAMRQWLHLYRLDPELPRPRAGAAAACASLLRRRRDAIALRAMQRHSASVEAASRFSAAVARGALLAQRQCSGRPFALPKPPVSRLRIARLQVPAGLLAVAKRHRQLCQRVQQVRRRRRRLLMLQAYFVMLLRRLVLVALLLRRRHHERPGRLQIAKLRDVARALRRRRKQRRLAASPRQLHAERPAMAEQRIRAGQWVRGCIDDVIAAARSAKADARVRPLSPAGSPAVSPSRARPPLSPPLVFATPSALGVPPAAALQLDAGFGGQGRPLPAAAPSGIRAPELAWGRAAGVPRPAPAAAGCSPGRPRAGLPSARSWLRQPRRRAASPPSPQPVTTCSGPVARPGSAPEAEAVRAASSWKELKPKRLSDEHRPYVRIFRKTEDVEGTPVTRLDAFFPGIEPHAVAECMLDVGERRKWDKNYTEFRMLADHSAAQQQQEAGCGEAEAGYKIPYGLHTMYHRVESSTLRLLGFSARDFVYLRETERCGKDCVLTRFRYSDPPPEAPIPDTGAVQARIRYQECIVDSQSEMAWLEDGGTPPTEAGAGRAEVKGARMRMTSCVDTGSRPPSGVIDMMCSLMGGQPYVWMRTHIEGRTAAA
eukprot:TRINITY_DN5449_c0_g2_i1.p1 TRINITY_DN5449_c0_g2~~TRINITY_DN5449_c0_g2_i1.p1  ORF type:complete len:634 (+),score=180.68 TRINITY_DN5449_c0_g2_i1:75-1904(+)